MHLKNQKNILIFSQLLIHFDPNKPLVLSCDPSAYEIRAMLAHQLSDGSEQSIEFVSRTLSPAEHKYLQMERELLACVFGVKIFRSYLFGQPFTLITDHKPLIS